MTQLISRGLRNAPVKNTRSMCTDSAMMNISAAQWWICRISSPPLMSKEMSTVERYASETVTPRSGRYEPSYTTWPALGTNQKVRNVPESRQMIIEYMATSPSMNDQW